MIKMKIAPCLSEREKKIVRAMKTLQAAWGYLVLLTAASSSERRARGEHLLHGSEGCWSCVGLRKTQASGKERVGSCRTYSAGAGSPTLLRSHELAELGGRGGYVDFVPGQAQSVATHRLAAPRRQSGP